MSCREQWVLTNKITTPSITFPADYQQLRSKNINFYQSIISEHLYQGEYIISLHIDLPIDPMEWEN